MPNKLQEYTVYQPSGTTGRRPKTLKERIADFWKYVNKDPNHPTGCWEWSKSTGSFGYGQFNLNGDIWPTHRLCYVIVHGEIPEGKFVCHECDNARCCNPDHLFIGTQNDNMQDMIAKGRDVHARWDDVPVAKLTSSQVSVIRSLYANKLIRKATIARAFGIHRHSIGAVIKGTTWKGVEVYPKDHPEVISMLKRIVSGEFNTNRPSQFGERHSQHKLNDQAVREIRLEYSRGKVKELASKFGVSIAAIRDVAYGRRWAHVK